MATAARRPERTYGTSAANEKKPQQEFLFDKQNYMWMIGGLALIFLAFLLMSGGKSPDPNQFNYDEIYSFRRITLAPIMLMLGFAVEVYAIMKKPKDNSPAEQPASAE